MGKLEIHSSPSKMKLKLKLWTVEVRAFLAQVIRAFLAQVVCAFLIRVIAALEAQVGDNFVHQKGEKKDTDHSGHNFVHKEGKQKDTDHSGQTSYKIGSGVSEGSGFTDDIGTGRQSTYGGNIGAKDTGSAYLSMGNAGSGTNGCQAFIRHAKIKGLDAKVSGQVAEVSKVLKDIKKVGSSSTKVSKPAVVAGGNFPAGNGAGRSLSMANTGSGINGSQVFLENAQAEDIDARVNGQTAKGMGVWKDIEKVGSSSVKVSKPKRVDD